MYLSNLFSFLLSFFLFFIFLFPSWSRAPSVCEGCLDPDMPLLRLFLSLLILPLFLSISSSTNFAVFPSTHSTFHFLYSPLLSFCYFAFYILTFILSHCILTILPPLRSSNPLLALASLPPLGSPPSPPLLPFHL